MGVGIDYTLFDIGAVESTAKKNLFAAFIQLFFSTPSFNFKRSTHAVCQFFQNAHMHSSFKACFQKVYTEPRIKTGSC
jgi:hypothetical protein